MPGTPPDSPPAPALPDVCSLVRHHQGEWRALGVRRVRVFGSVARAEAHSGSDVDVLLDLDGGAGLLALVRAGALFERLLGHRTDAVTEDGLKPPLKAEVLADAVDVQRPHPRRLHGAPKHWGFRAAEMLGCLDRVRRYTASVGPAAFLGSELVQDAVLRNVAQLGEVSKFIPAGVQERHPLVPWADLRRVRNLISHDYFGIDMELLWQTATRELPLVRPALAELAQDGAAGGRSGE